MRELKRRTRTPEIWEVNAYADSNKIIIRRGKETLQLDGDYRNNDHKRERAQQLCDCLNAAGGDSTGTTILGLAGHVEIMQMFPRDISDLLESKLPAAILVGRLMQVLTDSVEGGSGTLTDHTIIGDIVQGFEAEFFENFQSEFDVEVGVPDQSVLLAMTIAEVLDYLMEELKDRE